MLIPNYRVFIVGASAGGVETVIQLAKGLPADFAGALFVILHMAARTRSFLPEILERAGQISARHAIDGAPIVPGTIYVAPPNYHLIIERGHMHLNLGPKEQHQRPSINVTLRSAALSYAEAAVGVILTGELDDGTAGLWELKRRGGIAIVQNPEEAAFPSMPLSALRDVEADYVAKICDMGPLLARLAQAVPVGTRTEGEGTTTMHSELTDLTCPDCRGTIWEVTRGKSKEYRCRVGHTFSSKAMLSEHFAAQEKALYAAVVALEEGASLATRLANDFEGPVRDRLRGEAKEHEAQAEALRKILRERSSFSLD
jgi:two-component system chemotaxis response regulator CheB